jgi:hypothetical protein
MLKRSLLFSGFFFVCVLAGLSIARAEEEGAGEGPVVFSKQPIDPAKPQKLTNSFKAGDHIYGLMMPKKSWLEIYGEKAEQKAGLLLQWKIDDTDKVSGYINVVDPKYIKGKTLVFDIAPSIDKMTAYRDAGVEYDDWRSGIKKGACHFTFELGKLTPGKHTLSFWIMNYGEKPVLGSFEIEGTDYGFYTKLHEQIKAEVTGGRNLPPAQMTDKAMEAAMVKLLKNAGWSDVLRLNIVDKEWWFDRESGGDSAIVSRHLDAAAAYKDKDGKCYYRVCRFHQRRLISGEYGTLELTDQGKPVNLPEENIKK